jgi:hypothetical protein
MLRTFEGTHVARVVANPIRAEFPAINRAVDHIYLVDPLGNLMLRSSKNPDSTQMNKDLGRLLRASRTG